MDLSERKRLELNMAHEIPQKLHMWLRVAYQYILEH